MLIACCGHEIENLDAYWWPEWTRECEPCIACGVLCDECAPIYRAVRAETYEEAREKLKDVEPIDLIDILAGQYDAPIEDVDGWKMVSLGKECDN